jgi:hypothetical protein
MDDHRKQELIDEGVKFTERKEDQYLQVVKKEQLKKEM